MNLTPNPKVIQARHCVKAALEVMGDRWTGLIVRELDSGPRRFSELERALTGISPRTLSQRLDALTQAEIITRQSYSEIPPRTVYELTRKGRDLIPILRQMVQWGLKYASE